MYSAQVDPPWDLGSWRAEARRVLGAGIAPHAIAWRDALAGGLFHDDAPMERATPSDAGTAVRGARAPRVPRDFLDLAQSVLAHRDPHRHALLYRLLWRLVHGEPALLDDPLDPDVHRARALAKTVHRDLHKMKAFVRFRAVRGEHDAFVAWFEPEHHILDLVASFFMRRFTGMRWAILTPYRSVAWDGSTLAFGPGGAKSDAPADDAGEAMWKAYYASIFNPARINPRMMRQEMPQKYWKHLPEASLIPDLLRDAGARVQAMADRDRDPSRRPAMVARATPPSRESAAALPTTVEALRSAARGCRACPLWQPATQVVFGEGPADARIVLLGEQPGDEEDLRGRPFTGPAGRLLDRALAELGLDRATMYVTNTVKHFKFTRSGKVRLHVKANTAEQRACRPWLERELELVRPGIVVCLGATAVEAMLGRGVALTHARGRWHGEPGGLRLLATVHPSWVLRQRGGEAQAAGYRGLLADLSMLAMAPH